VDQVGWTEIDQFCAEAIAQNEPKQIITLNGEFVLTAQKNEQFREAINSADLVIPDSTNIVWASRIKKTPLKEVTAGSDLVIHLAKLASETNKSIYLLGAKEGIAKKAGEALKKQFPDLVIAGASSADPKPETVELIKKAKPDILLVAYPAPIQVTWIADNKKDLPCKIIVGVGGTFDMLAGVLPRAPKFIRVIHMEWFWRMIIQPSRWRRSWNALVVFMFKVIFS
jgi:N-acetylglucosaminyldiphosphoundecaprenol N-acetyl-beta-D-mannosaminyltransferase